MNNPDNRVYLVGTMDDDGKVKHIKGYTNVTWAIKNGKSLGAAARYAVVEGDFTSEVPEPRAVSTKATKETSVEIQ